MIAHRVKNRMKIHVSEITVTTRKEIDHLHKALTDIPPIKNENSLVWSDAMLELLQQLPEDMKIKLYSYSCWEDIDILKKQVKKYKQNQRIE